MFHVEHFYNIQKLPSRIININLAHRLNKIPEESEFPDKFRLFSVKLVVDIWGDAIAIIN